MHDKLWLFVVVAKSVCIAAIGVFSPVLAILGFHVTLTRGMETVLGLVMAVFPIGIACWWMFRRLQAHWTRREARAVTLAFAMFSPIWFGAGILLSEFTGGYADLLLLSIE